VFDSTTPLPLTLLLLHAYSTTPPPLTVSKTESPIPQTREEQPQTREEQLEVEVKRLRTQVPEVMTKTVSNAQTTPPGEELEDKQG
jgi:hypothetical protein